MAYLLNMVIFHGYVTNNQRVPFMHILGMNIYNQLFPCEDEGIAAGWPQWRWVNHKQSEALQGDAGAMAGTTDFGPFQYDSFNMFTLW
jgi:hypothetical protein